MVKAMPPPFASDSPAERGKEKTEYPGAAEPGRRSWLRHRQGAARSPSQHDVDVVVVLNEGGYVGPPPGSADGSCIEEADKECAFD